MPPLCAQWDGAMAIFSTYYAENRIQWHSDDDDNDDNDYNDGDDGDNDDNDGNDGDYSDDNDGNDGNYNDDNDYNDGDDDYNDDNYYNDGNDGDNDGNDGDNDDNDGNDGDYSDDNNGNDGDYNDDNDGNDDDDDDVASSKTFYTQTPILPWRVKNKTILQERSYILTPWSWALLEKPPPPPPAQPLKNFLILSEMNQVHNTPSSYLSNIYLSIIIPHMSRSSEWSLSFWISHRNPTCISLRPIRATYHVNLPILTWSL
jgi:hypothetical protein